MSENDGVIVELDPRREEREAYRAAKRKEDDRIAALVLGAERIPDELVVEVEHQLAKPLEFEDERRGKLRLTKVRVHKTRFLGERTVHPDEDDSPLHVAVRGWVYPLTAADEPHRQRVPGWTDLPE